MACSASRELRRATFQPERVDGLFEEAYTYVVMVFRQPVTSAPPSPPGRDAR